MAIQLPELRQAVIDYINSKIAVTVSDPVPGPGAGSAINPNDEFRFTVRVANANANAGGISLTDLRYNIDLRLPDGTDRAKVRAPSDGTSRDAGGNPIDAGKMVNFLAFDPTDPGESFLRTGEVQLRTFQGKIGGSSKDFTLSVDIEADPDINQLFPRNERTPKTTVNVIVEPV